MERNVINNLEGLQVIGYKGVHTLNYKGKIKQSRCGGFPINKIFVRNLPEEAEESYLIKLFTQFGQVVECELRKYKNIKFALVTFENNLQALHALKFYRKRELTEIANTNSLKLTSLDWLHQPIYNEFMQRCCMDPTENILYISTENSDHSKKSPFKGIQHENHISSIQNLNHDCLVRIFNFLPIADRVKLGRVCKTWWDASQESWALMRRLDISLASWGWQKSQIGSFDLYKVLKRCGHYLRIITFFEEHSMMVLRTILIISHFCKKLKFAYLRTLEVTPNEILFLLFNCPKIQFLEFDGYHFTNDDYRNLFSKCKNLKYVSFKNARCDGFCFKYLPKSTETLIFHQPPSEINYLIFHGAVNRLNNLQNLYIEMSFNDPARHIDPVLLMGSIIKKKPSYIKDFEDKEFYEYYEFCTNEKYSTYDNQVVDNESSIVHDLNFSIANTLKKIMTGPNSEKIKVLQLKGFILSLSTGQEMILNFSKFKVLEKLDMSHTTIFNDSHLGVIGANCQQLSLLMINACKEVTNIGIGSIAFLPKLTHLSMADIPKVTGKFLKMMKNLKVLDCTRCRSIQERQLNKLIQNAHKLETLNIESCKTLSNSLVNFAISEIHKRSKKVKLTIFAMNSSIKIKKLKNFSFVKIVMHLRSEEMNPFQDGDLGKISKVRYRILKKSCFDTEIEMQRTRDIRNLKRCKKIFNISIYLFLFIALFFVSLVANFPNYLCSYKFYSQQCEIPCFYINLIGCLCSTGVLKCGVTGMSKIKKYLTTAP